MWKNCSRKQFTDKLKFQIEKSSLKTELWDCTMVASQQRSKSPFMKTGEAIPTLRLRIVNWIKYNITSKKSWLSEASPETDGRSNSMILCTKEGFMSLDAERRKSENSTQEHTVTANSLPS